MAKALTIKEVKERVSKIGIICPDGKWKPYKLVEFTNTQKPIKLICPMHGEYTVCAAYHFFKSHLPHPTMSMERRKKTNLKKYGVENPLCSQEVKDKIKKTNMKRYGVENPFANEEVKEKIKQTNLKKYGVENPNQSIKIQNKTKKTNLERYGVVYNLQNEEIKEKIKKTNIKRYGVENPSQLPKTREKAKQTTLERYGVPYALQNKEIMRRIKKTNLERYGMETPLSRKEIQLKAIKAIEQKKVDGTWVCKFGKKESEVRDWFETTTNTKWPSNRTILEGKELDCYNEDYNLAIEFCGLYWHTENSPQPRLRQYHNDKRLKCEEKGIRLITIFEDDWEDREEQVKNFLLSVLSISSTKVYARKSIFKEISKKEAKQFLEEHHIQGAANLSKYCYGLFSDGLLLSVMTFGKHHRNIEDVLVLDRFAVKTGYSIPGGASKLFKNALKHLPKIKIVSWSDNRWSQGNVYEKLGFTLEEELGPDYSYFDKNKCIRISKQSQMKSNTGCPGDKTEKEWAIERGLWRIWDCGKKRWIFNNTKVVI